jgi:hypothetical protein
MNAQNNKKAPEITGKITRGVFFTSVLDVKKTPLAGCGQRVRPLINVKPAWLYNT